ncbi:MAG: hypothetical protein ABL916_11065 [Burkholderiaceae bacterium]
MDTANSTNDEWIRRFAARLGELRPPVAGGEAMEVAQLAFGSANDLAPEEAAAVFAEILDARVPVHDLKRWMTREESPLKAGR